MGIIYTTKINGARVTSQGDLDNVIKEVDVTITGQDSGCSFQLPATVAFGPANPDDFTDFADLTEEQLIEWVEAQDSLVSVKAHIAYVVAKEVEKAGLISKPLPWEPVPVPIAEPLAQ